jgi:murein hydrolase activator
MKIKKIILIVTMLVFASAGHMTLNPQNEEKLDAISKQIQEISDKLENLKKEENTVLNEIYKAELQHDMAVVENNKIKIQVRDAEIVLEKKIAEKNILETSIEKSKKNIEIMLRILYKIGGNSYLKLFIRIDNLDQLFRNYRLFIGLIDYKSIEINRLKKDVEQLNQVKNELQQQYDKLQNLQQEKEQKVRNMLVLKAEKISLIKQINNDKDRYMRMLDELETEADRLNATLTGKITKRRMGVIDLSKIKGKLKWPIDGKVISSFGKKKSTKFDTYIISNGIQIKPTDSEEVKAVYPGEVVYAEYVRGYGNLIIVQHARNLYTLYGHCDKFIKKVGDNVSEGEVISVAGDTGSLVGKALYFEIRTYVHPQDPMEWLRKKR